MSFQESQLFEYERLNTPNPLPRLRVDAQGNLLAGLHGAATEQEQAFFRWLFTE